MSNVLVTGSSRGIGLSIAEEFAGHGFNVILNCSASSAEIREKAEYIKKKYAVRAIGIKADVSNEKAVVRMFETIEKEFGGIDVLVNNAGISYSGLVQEMSYDEWKRVFDVNVNGAFLCTKHALRHMIGKKSGSVINISSIWGQTGASCEVAYSSSKAALIGFTKSLAKELAPSGIRVNCIAPGMIDTKMNELYSEQDIDEFVEDVPLGRIGKGMDIAGMTYFLTTDSCSYITGQVIGINGGFVC